MNNEFGLLMVERRCTSNHLVRIYLSFMTFYHGRDIQEEEKKMLEEFTKNIVEHWVDRGFDSDELVALGKLKSVEFLIKVAEMAPSLDN